MIHPPDLLGCQRHARSKSYKRIGRVTGSNTVAALRSVDPTCQRPARPELLTSRFRAG